NPTAGQVLSAAAPSGGKCILSWASAGGGVSSFSGDGVIVTNSGSTGAVTMTIAGTSGGVPYFPSTSAWASSALRASHAIRQGGGAGTAPTTGNGDFTIDGTAHTLLAGAAGLVNFGAASTTTGFKIPLGAGAVPTADGFESFNTTNHTSVFGSNGN